MNDDELKTLWQQQPLREPVPSAAQLISAMQNKTSRCFAAFCLTLRDIRELVVCAFVIIVFGCFAFFSLRYASRADFASRRLDCHRKHHFASPGKLIHTRRTTPPAPTRRDNRRTISAGRTEFGAQSQSRLLLGSVLYGWYLLPGLCRPARDDLGWLADQ